MDPDVESFTDWRHVPSPAAIRSSILSKHVQGVGSSTTTPFRYASLSSAGSTQGWSASPQQGAGDDSSLLTPAVSSTARTSIPPLLSPLFAASASSGSSSHKTAPTASAGFRGSRHRDVLLSGPRAAWEDPMPRSTSKVYNDPQRDSPHDEVDNAPPPRQSRTRLRLDESMSPMPARSDPSDDSHPSRAGTTAHPSFLADDDMSFARGGTPLGNTSFSISAGHMAQPAASTDDVSRTPYRAAMHDCGETPVKGATPQHTAAKPATGGNAASSARDIAQRYFTIVRQVQEQDSPLKPNQYEQQPSSIGEKNINSNVSAADASHTAAAGPAHQPDPSKLRHPQEHLINRHFALYCGDDGACYIRRRASSTDSSDASGADAENEILPQRVFNCQQEVSMLVNMGDVALCRLIDVRTHLTVEREAYTHLCRATSAICSALPEKLRLEVAASSKATPPADSSNAHLQTDSVAAGLSEEFVQEAVELANRAVSIVRGDVQAQELVRQLLGFVVHVPSGSATQEDAATTTDPDTARYAVRILRDLVEEAEASAGKSLPSRQSSPAKQKATSSHQRTSSSSSATPDAFQMEALEEDLAMLHAREEEAKLVGNLALGASARREYIQRLHTGLMHCLEECTRMSEKAFNGDAADKQKKTDATIQEAVQQVQRAASDARAVLQSTKAELQKRESSRQEFEVARRETVRSHDIFMLENDNGISSTIREIDQLHAKLESLIHQRSTKAKEFAAKMGQSLVALEDAAHLVSDGAAAVSAAEKRMHSVEAARQRVEAALQSNTRREGSTDAAVVTPPLISAFRAATTRSGASAQQDAKEYLLRLQSDGVKVASQLRHTVLQWLEVLLRNQTREMERSAILAAQIKDAMERYHQEDVDLFKAQLDDCHKRKKKVDQEIDELESLLKHDDRCGSQCIPFFASLVMAQHSSSSAPPQANNASGSRPGSSAAASFGTPRPGAAHHSAMSPSPAPRGPPESQSHSTPEKQHIHRQYQNVQSPLYAFQQFGTPAGGESLRSPPPAASSRVTSPGQRTVVGGASPTPSHRTTTCLVVVDADASASPPPSAYPHGSFAYASRPPVSARARAVSREQQEDPDDRNSSPLPQVNRLDESDGEMSGHHRYSDSLSMVDTPPPRRRRNEDIEASLTDDEDSPSPLQPLCAMDTLPPLPFDDASHHDAAHRAPCEAYHSDETYGAMAVLSEAPVTEEVDIDQLTVEEAVSLFRRSEAVAYKWTSILQQADIETVRDLRELRARNPRAWEESFLANYTLLKTMLETLLDDPQHFVVADESSK